MDIKQRYFEAIQLKFESISHIPAGSEWCDGRIAREGAYHFSETGERNDSYTAAWWAFLDGYFAGRDAAYDDAELSARYELLHQDNTEEFIAAARKRSAGTTDESEVIYVS